MLLGRRAGTSRASEVETDGHWLVRQADWFADHRHVTRVDSVLRLKAHAVADAREGLARWQGLPEAAE